MANYTISDDKCLNNVLDVVPVKILSGITGDMSWAQVFARCSEGINIYAVNSCGTPFYPVAIEETDRKAALIKITYKTNGTAHVLAIAKIEFFYEGAIYTREFKNTSARGEILTDWVQIANVAYVTSQITQLNSDINTLIQVKYDELNTKIGLLDARVTALENG